MSKLPILLALLLVPLAGAEGRSEHPGNELVEFASSDSWEIWCIRLGDTGEIVCDLNQVIIYMPHPDFRAMIPRVYWTEKEQYRVEFEYERQTSFSDAGLVSTSGGEFSLDHCDRPCLMHGATAAEFVRFLENSTDVQIRFTDYFVQDFLVDLDVEGFAHGLDLLRQMQTRLRGAGSQGRK